MQKSHYAPPTGDQRTKFVKQDRKNWTFKPQALEIMWGGDRRYWDVPEDPKKPVELKQVSWLEVTGKLELSKLEKGGNYKVIFTLLLKTDAFGWNYGPIYFTARPGQTAQYIWRAADLSTKQPEKDFNIEIPFTAPPTNPTDKDELLFGIYEIWNGRWKGGLVIKEVSILSS